MLIKFGRHNRYYNSAGNKRLRAIVQESVPAYRNARDRNARGEKSQLLRNVLEQVHAEGHTFVRMVNNKPLQATEKQCISKISHLFRDLIFAELRTARIRGGVRSRRRRRHRNPTPPPPANDIEERSTFENLEGVEWNALNDFDDAASILLHTEVSPIHNRQETQEPSVNNESPDGLEGVVVFELGNLLCDGDGEIAGFDS